jgi:hypothetical protein
MPVGYQRSRLQYLYKLFRAVQQHYAGSVVGTSRNECILTLEYSFKVVEPCGAM